MGICLPGLLACPACPRLRIHLSFLPNVLGRKFPNAEEQSDSPSIQLLEKKKETKIMHHAMEQKKEVRWRLWGWGQEREPSGTQGEQVDSPPFCVVDRDS